MAVKPKVPKNPPPDETTPAAAAPDLVEFVYSGFTFVIPRSRGDWSTKGIAFLAEDKFSAFAKYTLEIARPGQWEAVCELCPTPRDFGKFYVALTAATRECTD